MSETSPPVGDLLIAVFNSVAEVIVLCLCGYFLAVKKVINKNSTKLLNKLNVDLFTPALLFSKVAFSLSPSKLKELRIIPIGFLVITSVSVFAAWFLGHLVGLNKRQRNFAIACGAFQNSNSLPIALMQSLVVTVPHLKWTTHDTKETMLGRALTYLVVYSTLGQILRWSWGVKLLTEADEGNDSRSINESEQGTVYNDVERDPAAALVRNTGFNQTQSSTSTSNQLSHQPSIAFTPSSPTIGNGDAKQSQDQDENQLQVHNYDENDSISSDTDDYSLDEEWGIPNNNGKVDGAKYRFKKIYNKIAKKLRPLTSLIKRIYVAFRTFMTPPLWAAFISLIIALIRPLQAVLDKATPIRGAIKSAGNVSVPLTLVVLGAYFYSSTPTSQPITIQAHDVDDTLTRRASIVTSIHSFANNVLDISKPRSRPNVGNEQEKRTIFVSVFARMIVTPALLLPLFLWDDITRNKTFSDPVFIVSACLIIGSPPALTLSQLTQATSGDSFEKLISRTLFISYALITPITSIIIVALGLVLSKEV